MDAREDCFDNWTVQVRKGLLELCILNALDSAKERYGYDLVKTLVDVPGLGVTEGTIYPLLSRLRVQGLVTARLEESPEGPARKYYSLTAKGRKAMALMNEHLDLLTRSTRDLPKARRLTMREWTDAAKTELERYLRQCEASCAAEGADAREVADDLRRHVQEELAAAGAGAVTQDDVRRLLARIGSPEPPAAIADSGDQRPSPVPSGGEAGPASARRRRLGMALLLMFGVVLPLFTLVLEWVSGMCASVFFDPIPSIWHVVLVALVPLANAAACAAIATRTGRHRATLGWLSAMAVAVALYYAAMFLPLTPFAVLGVLYFGFGLVPLAPLISLIAALRLRRRLKELCKDGGRPLSPRLWQAVALVLLITLGLGLPKGLTLAGLRMAASENPAAHVRGVRLLRAWGSEDILLRACYDIRKPVVDLVGFLDNLIGGPLAASEVQAIFYKVTGTPYNAVKPPDIRGLRRGALIDASDFDFGLGGDAVAAKVRGLTLSQSRMDGVVDSIGCTAYVEWTMVFRNASARQQEARAQIALPPDGVVSRLTLWIDGQEREAAFGGRSRVKDAYKKVVQQRRDPVLVTTSGADQVLLQCFPVPPNGGEMKVRIGVTAPLFLESTESGLLRLPSFLEENFAAAPRLRHSVWVEGDGLLTAMGNDQSLVAEHLEERKYALRGELSHEALADMPTVRATRPLPVTESWCEDTRSRAGHLVRQTVNRQPVAAPGRVVIVVDGSRRMGPLAGALAQVIQGCPRNVNLSLILASDEVIESGHAGMAEQVRGFAFEGGCDNVPALLRAWELAAADPAGAIVWLHATQPVQMTDSEALLQKWQRRPGYPVLYDFQFGAGPNKVAEVLNGLPAVRRPPCFGDATNGVCRLFQQWSGTSGAHTYERRREPAGGPLPADSRGSSHMARLWARDEVRRLAAGGDEPGLKAAVDMALAYQLVTPVSGAVVLETEKQYADAGLTPAAPGSFPQVVPEPSTWALALIGAVVILVVRRWRTPHETLAGR